MVCDATDGFRHAFGVPHPAAEVGVQAFASRGGDDECAVFCAEDYVVMQRDVCVDGMACEVPAPLPGRVAFSTRNPVADATG